jgi:hypothetical protein
MRPKPSGIKTERLAFLTFVKHGVLALLAGLAFASRLKPNSFGISTHGRSYLPKVRELPVAATQQVRPEPVCCRAG